MGVLAGPRLPASRVLVIRLGALGDVVRTRFAFPGIRELYPDARIDWLVEDGAAAGLEGITGLDGVVTLRRSQFGARRPSSLWSVPAAALRELRKGDYDLALDFHGILKSALLAWAARIPRRVGYAAPLGREASPLLYTHRVPAHRDHLPRFERNAALVEYLGGRVPTRAPALELPPAARIEGLPDAYYVIHPGTSPGTLYKRWPAERWARVAARLKRETGVVSVVTWGPVRGERECAEDVVARADGAALLAPATDSIAQLLELMRRGRLFLGGDSGPLHLAALAGLPLAVVFGPTDPVENAPFPGAGVRVVRHDVGCNPCREGCPTRSCLAAIEPDEVAAAALELVSGA